MRVGRTHTYVNPLLLQSEQYQRHTQMLERKIEEQAKTILHLKARGQSRLQEAKANSATIYLLTLYKSDFSLCGK